MIDRKLAIHAIQKLNLRLSATNKLDKMLFRRLYEHIVRVVDDFGEFNDLRGMEFIKESHDPDVTNSSYNRKGL